MARGRRYPVGAEVVDGEGVHFRVWAPRRKSVAVAVNGGPTGGHALKAEDDGYFSGLVTGVSAGTPYRLQLDGGEAFPDPASRYQPEGPHGPSEVVDPASFRWTDTDWKGVRLPGQVLYEMHVGTFTPEGTWEAADAQLPELAACGITCLEVMPVAEFPGRFGWGYDGVDLFAPTRLYGRPDDFRRFVDAAHALGVGVILDVVYNHLGPDGNYLKEFAPAYFTDKYKTEWGEPINFDGPGSGPVREFFAANAAYWIDEYHLDGLRLDATQNIYDDTPDPTKHILTEIGRARPGRRRRAGDHRRQRERAAAPEAGPPRRGRRLRARCALERRLPPLRDGRPDRPERGVLHRLPRHAAGVHLVASSTATCTRASGTPGRRSGAAGRGSTCRRRLRHVHPEPRPDRQQRPRAAGAPAHQPRPLPGDDGADAPRPRHADAVPGPGVRRVRAVLLLRRPRAGPGEARPGRAGRVPGPVPQPVRRRHVEGVRRPREPRHVRAVQARLRRTRRPTPPPTG